MRELHQQRLETAERYRARIVAEGELHTPITRCQRGSTGGTKGSLSEISQEKILKSSA